MVRVIKHSGSIHAHNQLDGNLLPQAQTVGLALITDTRTQRPCQRGGYRKEIVQPIEFFDEFLDCMVNQGGPARWLRWVISQFKPVKHMWLGDIWALSCMDAPVLQGEN